MRSTVPPFLNCHSAWGAVQTAREIIPGVVLVTTASHGGFWLSPERAAEAKAKLPAFRPWAGWPWLEEDCDCNAAALLWPDEFTAAGQAGFVAGARRYAASGDAYAAPLAHLVS